MSESYGSLFNRRIYKVALDRMKDEPVIFLHGPRSVGKSTLLLQLADNLSVAVIDLDDPVVRDAVKAGPVNAMNDSTPILLDEYQYVPEVLDAIKARLNREGSLPGTAVMTGSTRFDTLPRTAQALTGRLHLLNIWPLSQGEIWGSEENLIPKLLNDPENTVASLPRSDSTRQEYVARIITGGFPMAISRSSNVSRNRWFDDYIMQSIERDSVELVRIRQRQILQRLFSTVASQTAQILNVTKVGAGLEIDRKTLESYLRLLEDLYLIVRLPAWGKTLRTRANSKPKIHVVDSGLAARVLRLSLERVLSFDATAITVLGNVLETFVVGELRKQISWLDEKVLCGHWRTSADDEVDFVIEFDDGSVIAFEIKAGERITGAEFRGLRKLRVALGKRFIAGVAFTMGSRSYNYEDRLYVMPLDRLWRTVP